MTPRLPASLLTARRALATAAAGLALGTLALPAAAQAQTSTPINTVVLRMTGELNIVFDKTFLKTLSRSKAKLTVKSGAKYRSKTRTATLPIDAPSTITLSPSATDVFAKGTIMMRRPDGRKITVQDVTLRLQPTGADLSASLRGKHSRQLSALTLSPTTAIQQQPDGYTFVDVQMLVSEDLAKAARQAKIKNVRAGALLGLMTAEVKAELPTFGLPTIPGLFPTE